tara:strand:+ start:296 stop:520 length:225 start_codon:yes stop_codon:yes gene_type:complete
MHSNEFKNKDNLKTENHNSFLKQTKYDSSSKNNVNINSLLNRVKLEEKNIKLKKIITISVIFFSIISYGIINTF